MSNPKNPLDDFASYTYHFELHAATTWDELLPIFSSDKNDQTTSTLGRGTLLINTRQDAHQSIDHVKFNYLGPSLNPDCHFIPSGNITFSVFEPNRIAFLTKINNLMTVNNISSLQYLHWALKVIFVGQTFDNTQTSLPPPADGLVIPMIFSAMDSTFGSQGGIYNMQFVSVADFARATSNNNSLDNIISLGHFTTSLKDKVISSRQPDEKSGSQTDSTKQAPAPVQERNDLVVEMQGSGTKLACRSLAIELNKLYQDTYKTMLKNDVGAKDIKYNINFDIELDKPLSNKVPITFDPHLSITDCIYKIIRASDELNVIVNTSYNGIHKDGHPDVNFISIMPRMIYRDTYVEINYDVSMYKGTNTDMHGIIGGIEFDYLFSDPGKNVDILKFDIHMIHGIAWFANSTKGGINHNTVDKKALGTNISKNDSAIKVSDNKIDNRFAIPAQKNDIALWNVVVPDNRGSVTMKPDAVENQQLMFSTVAEMHGAFAPQAIFTIRGNIDLLRAGVILPDTDLSAMKRIPFGVRSPFWIKVNIKDQDGSPFYYTGRYLVSSIENHFNNGQFTQDISVIMMPGTTADSGGKSQQPTQTRTIAHKTGGGKIPTNWKSGSEPYNSMFHAASTKYGVPMELLQAVAWRESKFDPNANNAGLNKNGTYDSGIMQLNSKMGPQFNYADTKNLNTYDPNASIDVAARYLSSLHDQTGSWTSAVAAYNQGLGSLRANGVANQGYVNDIMTMSGVK